MTSILAMLLTGITILPADDAACANAPKGWIRGVVRITTDKSDSSPAPKETDAVVRHFSEVGKRLVEDGIVGHAAVDANGAFSINVEPKVRTRLLHISIHVQMNWTTEGVSLTFDPVLFKAGMCLDVSLRDEPRR